MQQITTISNLRKQLEPVRQSGKKIGLVPTMGNLHEGHLSLVKHVQGRADYIVVSLFVNPTQFVEGEDFENYPRTLASDLKKLEKLNVDSVFLPNNTEIYPDSNQIDAVVTVPELDSIYCGKFRPGHFKGVATVVTKLFNIVQPDMAIFGQKDYQQLLLIRSLTRSLDLPIEIIVAPTIREKDGLAMSSRNQYLTESERHQAPMLHECLCQIADDIKNGKSDYKKLENGAISSLKEAGFRPEYLSICDAETLKTPISQNIVIIVAAWLGKARLIDNVAVQ